ncbi:hypothetical protein [Clostridium sp.]|uniref:hypothetical protein n=1 Tax=Clostridium sp. TaxID=1506 RepID=UPI003D6D1284
MPTNLPVDIEYRILLTRRQTNLIMAHPEKYKFMPKNQNFDYLPVGDKGIYPINTRIVRFPISENTLHSFTSACHPSEEVSDELASGVIIHMLSHRFIIEK